MIRLLILALIPCYCLAFDFDPFLTAKANKAKQQAEEAFAQKDYAIAISRYKQLLDTLKIKDESAELNLAHAFMRKADYANATSYYTKSTTATDPKIRSIAYQQLGILKSEKGEKEEAKTCFKNALRHNPLNKEALHNYELLVRAKEKEMPQPQDQKDRKEQEKKNKEQEQKKDQKSDSQKGEGDKNKGEKDNKGEKEDKQGQDKSDKGQDKDGKGNKGKEEDKNGNEKQKDQNGSKDPSDDKKTDNPLKEGDKKQEKSKQDEQGDKKGKVEDAIAKNGDKKDERNAKTTIVNREQLQRMNMTEHQAKALLNAMKQQEVQYIQQQKKQSTKQSNNKNYKDW